MARPVTVTLTHDLGKAEAKDRLHKGFDQIRDVMTNGKLVKFEESWTDDGVQFRAKGLGQNITGRIECWDQYVQIEVTLPGILAKLAETIAGRVEKQGQLLLEKK